MPKQEGLLKVKGTMDDLNYYKTKDGVYRVRKKGGVDAARIQNDPRYERTRQNNAEFGRSCRAGGKIRRSLRPVLSPSNTDPRTVGRLSKVMHMITKSDPVNDRGMRTPMEGEPDPLNGFEFNVQSHMGYILGEKIEYTMGTGSGDFSLQAGFELPKDIIPDGSDVGQFSLSLLTIDVDKEDTFDLDIVKSDFFDLNTGLLADLNLSVTQSSSISPAFQLLFLGLEFSQEVNGKYYDFKGQKTNSLRCLESLKIS
ncbi:hypothetical protein [Echinicola shivajiensis]|uniref:hypothetical protein n=1 Tax=Echinicola shivajiensis TaxID=1035916 RepID=UPI001BFC5DF6|nr:hypothetical protein [Echinicola shivajiensis]